MLTTFGISPMHGPHQLAQKSTSTTLPRYFARSISCPSAAVNFKSTGLVLSPAIFSRRSSVACACAARSLSELCGKLLQRRFALRRCVVSQKLDLDPFHFGGQGMLGIFFQDDLPAALRKAA